MKRNVITEIVNFEIANDLSESDFINIVEIVEEQFHMKQSGYIDSELLKGKKNFWTIIMHWESLEQVKQASKLMMKDKTTENFRQAIIPTSVQMSYLEQVKIWQIE
jgi:heme-degrading monooxygenase HmoA